MTIMIIHHRQIDHISYIMRDKLHIGCNLRAGERVDYKLYLLVYKAVHGLAPDYIAEMFLPVSSVEVRQLLRSSQLHAGSLTVNSCN